MKNIRPALFVLFILVLPPALADPYHDEAGILFVDPEGDAGITATPEVDIIAMEAAESVAGTSLSIQLASGYDGAVPHDARFEFRFSTITSESARLFVVVERGAVEGAALHEIRNGVPRSTAVEASYENGVVRFQVPRQLLSEGMRDLYAKSALVPCCLNTGATIIGDRLPDEGAVQP